MNRVSSGTKRGLSAGGSGAGAQAAPVPDASAYRTAIRKLRRPAKMAAGFSAVINVLMLTGSLYMLQVYDRVLGSGSVATLQGLFVIVIVAYVFYGIYEFLRARVLSRAAMQLSHAVSPAAFRAWLRSGLDGERGQALPLRDLEILRSFIASPIVGTIFDLPWIPLYLAVLFLIHPMLGWVTIGGVLVVVAVAYLNKRLTQDAIDRTLVEETAARNFADTGLHSAETIAAMGMTDAVLDRWRDLQGASLATGQQAADITEATSSFSKAFRMLLQSLLLTVGAWLVLGQEMSAGMIIAASVISGRLLAPIDQIIGQWKQVGRATTAHRRLTGFFDAQTAPSEALGLAKPTGRILATDLVRFAPGTPGRERRRQIDRVSFSLAPGAGLGVIGDSASGKSSLARLIVGAFGADAGDLRFDGATRAQWGSAELGRHIGYLPQTVTMLPGTVRDNIRRFDASRSAQEVITAAQLAGVHEMILRLPEGYGTVLGGADQPLSGGQLQRIGLARAVFGSPAIVVLDEPNSNLDETGENALRQTVRSLRAAGTTVILMTHRLPILQEMDQILMLRNGGVVRYGPADELLGGLGAVSGAADPGNKPILFPRPVSADSAGALHVVKAAEKTLTAKTSDTDPKIPAVAQAADPPSATKRMALIQAAGIFQRKALETEAKGVLPSAAARLAAAEMALSSAQENIFSDMRPQAKRGSAK